MKAFLITTLALASMGCAVAQDPHEPPPPPPMRGDAASLQDTMKFIQDKLPSKVNLMVYAHDNVAGTDKSVHLSVDVSNVSANPDRCRIDFHWLVIVDGKANSDKDTGFLLKDAQEIVVMPFEQEQQLKTAKAGHPERSVKVDPPAFALIVKRSDAKENDFDFYDETMANRVAKALQHAVDLCGGGNQEPF
jgi:hypothetical protein